MFRTFDADLRTLYANLRTVERDNAHQPEKRDLGVITSRLIRVKHKSLMGLSSISLIKSVAFIVCIKGN